MKLCFEGVRHNALREIKALEKLASGNPEYDEDDNTTFAVDTCISAYHDMLLALMKGAIDIEEAKNFLLWKKTEEEIAAIPYCGRVVLLSEDSPQ